mgnify:CR=1 FL=1
MLTVYLAQAGGYSGISINGPSLYNLLPSTMDNGMLYDLFGSMAMALGLAMMVVVCLMLCLNRTHITREGTLLACLLVLVVFGYVQLFEATSEVSKLENQLSALQSQQKQLQSRYEARIDLDAIETAAGDLGLTKPSQEQIVYLDLSGADRAEIYQE